MKQRTVAELLVMRHAKSDWSGNQSDIERPLNNRGQGDAKRMGQWLSYHQLAPDQIISSTSLRTRQTVELLCAQLANRPTTVEYEPDIYLAPANILYDHIVRNVEPENRLMILAHNPGIDDVVEYLSNQALPLTASNKLMTTAAIAHFQLQLHGGEIDRSETTLINLIRPSDI